MSHSIKAVISCAAAVCVLLASAPAGALNFGPAVWRYAGAADGRSIVSCQLAVDLGIAAEQRAIAPKTIISMFGQDGCATTTGSFKVFYRDSVQDPNSLNREILIVGYCEGENVAGPPFFDAAKGFYCPGTLAPRSPKNNGYCADCEALALVGNPTNVGFGNKLEMETDYVGAGPFPLKLTRLYNSGRGTRSNQPGLGAAWIHPYYRRLAFGGPNASTIVSVSAYRPDGRAFYFNQSGGVWVADQDIPERLEQLPSAWRLTNRDDEVELYDAAGKLLSITNRAGLAHTLTYVASGQTAGLLDKVTDAFGRTLSFEYNNNRLAISAMVDPGSGRYEYGYFTTFGMEVLTSIKYPDNNTRTYHRENTNNGTLLTGITDENGVRFATYVYVDANAGAPKPALTFHAGVANRTDIQYFADGLGNLSADVTAYVSATSTATRHYTFQSVLGVQKLTSITGPACPSCGTASSTYDANGNVNSSTDWNGNRTGIAYDTARNLETARAEGLTSTGADTPQTVRSGYQWHPIFRLPTTRREPLRITTYAYDPDGMQCGARGAMCSKSIQATTDSNGSQGFGATPAASPRTWTYTYDANGQVLTVDGPRTDVADTTTYTYFANDDADLNKRGNVATITNAAGHVTSVTSYNAHGQPLTIVDPNGLTTTLTYDLRRRLKTRDVGGELTSYDYDNAGQLTKVTLPDGSFLSYSYDLAHRLTGIQDNLGNRIAYTLDLAGNRTQEQVFDPSNALAQTRSRVYSSINRLFQELDSAGQITEYGYDNQGNVTSVKDPLNHLTSNQYDPLNRLKQATDPALGVTQYAYNGLDALTQVTDPRNLVTGYTVDGLGNLTLQASPDTGNTVNTYDLAGNLATQTDAKNQTTSYTYDALNRVTLISFHDGSKQAYAYDQGVNGLGRLTSITETDPANQVTGLIAYGYDQKGRVTSETRTVNGVAYVLAYSYDSSGRLTGMTYPSGRAITYTFDSLGRVSQVTTTKDALSQVVVQNVQYHPFGGAKSWTLGNGQIYSRTIDQDGRIASYTLGASSYALGFDAASRITAIGANTYGYDVLDRLNSAILPSSNFAYSYDAVGNRTTKTVGANSDTYSYSASSNRIATLTPFGAPQRGFVFDANGSTTDDGLNIYAYDTRGRMVQATSTIGSTSYQVNALGQRIRKANSLGDTVFHYDTRGKLIAESDPGGTLKREYLYLGDIPVGVVQ